MPRRYASGSYGDSQSGHQEANKDTSNPKADLEHPGPKAPADKGTAQSGQSQDSSSQSPPSSSSGGRPAIHQPGPPPENKDAEVEAHNKDMENRSDRTANQLYEEDNRVDKNFWSGAKSYLRSTHRKYLLTNAVGNKQETLDRNLERKKISDENLS
jgi:hypothetical protein